MIGSKGLDGDDTPDDLLHNNPSFVKDDSPGERQDAVESCSAEMLFDIDQTLAVNSASAAAAGREDVDGAARRYS